MGNRLSQEDFVGAGFKRLDDEKIVQHPPKIKWGAGYQAMPLRERIRYLERVASAMNYAAAQIQDERNDLNRLIALKEKQVKAAATALDQNNAMIQSEITRMNEERQRYNAEIAKLRARVRELEK